MVINKYYGALSLHDGAIYFPRSEEIWMTSSLIIPEVIIQQTRFLRNLSRVMASGVYLLDYSNFLKCSMSYFGRLNSSQM